MHPDRMKTLTALLLCSWIAVAGASEFLAVDAEIKAIDARVAELQQEFAKIPPAPNDKDWVKAKLAHMVEVDQYVRSKTQVPAGLKEDGERYEYTQRVADRMGEVDHQNTADLKALLRTYRWFTINEFGERASLNAWLLVQHADADAAFQREVLAILEPLAAKGETNPKNYAYLYDRVASSFQNPAARKPQRYGTQGQCSGPGTWEPLPVEDPDKLEARRAEMGLSSMAEYKKNFVNLCHESTEESIRRAMEQVKKKDPTATLKQ